MDSSPVSDFKTFEHEGWERAALPYRDAFSPLTAQAVDPLLDAAGVRHGTRMLDVACGPGDGSAAAAARGARVTGVDFAKAMVLQASRIHPAIEFRVGDAEALPFDAGRFDAVTINFGILHFADPDRAIAEACRVLRAGGRLAFTAWMPPEKTLAFAIVRRAVEAHGRLDVGIPEGPPFFRFAEPGEGPLVMEGCGFRGVETRELPLLWRLEAAEDLFDAFWEGGVRTRGVLRAQSPRAVTAIREAVRCEAAGYERGGAVELPMPAMLIAGVKGQ